MRFGPPVFDGSALQYPVWWIKSMPNDSEAFRQLCWIRAIYPRIKSVLGTQWLDEIKESSDYRFHHEEMAVQIECWEDAKDDLKQKRQEIDLNTASEYMRSMLDEFDPMWPDDREYGDYDDDETPKIINERTVQQRIAAKLEVESVYRDLDAFDAEVINKKTHKRSRTDD